MPTWPGPPYNVSATPVSNSQINLAWSQDGTYGYTQIYRNGAWLETISGSATSYSSTGLLPATEYAYYILSYIEAWFQSDTKTATTLLNAPSGLSATAVSTAQINQAWTNGDTYDNVYVEAKKLDTSWAVIATKAGGDTSNSHTGLEPGTTYQYRVRGVRNGIYTNYTSVASATTTINPPTSPSAQSTAFNSITTSWTNGDPYDYMKIERRVSGGTFVEIASIDGGLTSYADTTIASNTTYEYRVRGVVDIYTTYSSTVSATAWGESDTSSVTCSASASYTYVIGISAAATVTCSGAATYTASYTEADTATVTCSAFSAYSIIAKQNFGLYFGDIDGKVYRYDGAYYGDGTYPITSIWQSKETDFADQSPEMINRFKTVYKARLLYVDKTASMPVTLYISNDGGVTWTSSSKMVGTGTDTTKTAFFYPVVSGQTFVFKVESASVDKDFQWVSLEIEYLPLGEGFEV